MSFNYIPFIITFLVELKKNKLRELNIINLKMRNNYIISKLKPIISLRSLHKWTSMWNKDKTSFGSGERTIPRETWWIYRQFNLWKRWHDLKLVAINLLSKKMVMNLDIFHSCIQYRIESEIYNINIIILKY